ncbi:unnamed protein product [Merluccius merluccius]
MAWPCISRVCCLARFWNQFDKSDLSVPLTIQNYSDIAEQQEVRSVTKQVPQDHRVHRDGTGTGRESFRGRRELGHKPREDYHPPDVPFPSVTQYKQDFKPWPIPRKEHFPWVGNGRTGGAADGPGNGHLDAQGRRSEGDEGARAPKWAEPQNAGTAKTSSYRQEYRQWSGAKPAKSTRRSQTSPYMGSQSQAGQLTPETSYQAAFSGESHRFTSTNPTPTVTTTTTIPAGQSGPDHLVRTKLPANPSALFQSGSRVFNI